MNDKGEIDFWDFIALWSLDIGLQNLSLNQIQVDGIMREMQENQDGLLKQIIEQNKEIISLLEELKNARN